MAELKTKPNDKSVIDFLNNVENDIKREDSFTILELMKEVTGFEPIMWGDSIVGFGTYHYKYASGREADWFLTGFSPRCPEPDHLHHGWFYRVRCSAGEIGQAFYR